MTYKHQHKNICNHDPKLKQYGIHKATKHNAKQLSM